LNIADSWSVDRRDGEQQKGKGNGKEETTEENKERKDKGLF